MTFLEAKRILARQNSGQSLPFLLAMSGTSDQLDLFLRAHAAGKGLLATPRFLPFGTLAQTLFSPAKQDELELFLLLPWDFAPECDWRNGINAVPPQLEDVVARANQFAKGVAKRPQAHIVYLPGPIPPIFASQIDSDRLAVELTAIALQLGARLLPASMFSMTSYLSSGNPIAGTHLSDAALIMVELLVARPATDFKLLVTDADNTLWAGLVGEDGTDALSAEPSGAGFRHFIYQTALKRLKACGILLAVVSRNDVDMVHAALMRGRMPLDSADFAAIRAGYGAKSDHIRALAETLNLGIDSVVFVDDNPVELIEVNAALPQVTCLGFPAHEAELPQFLECLGRFFDRGVVTAEDAERTAMYQRRRETVPIGGEANLTDFLRGLDMTLTVHDRSESGYQRAHQLINKTNQFNLNGRRLNEDELSAMLAGGAKLFTADLHDRTGSHGEIIACLIEPSAHILSFVMSCRVFQRRVEFAFFAWLLRRWSGPALRLDFAATERNEPFRNFLADPAFAASDSTWSVNDTQFLADHLADLALFTIREHEA